MRDPANQLPCAYGLLGPRFKTGRMGSPQARRPEHTQMPRHAREARAADHD
ncbi:unnamed protein product [Brassica napus]|uniref:(rape) hypothetical protein n=1 Tax=Brassica napus TaxID=3708 RepID=A0A816SZK3_BRANA|nr:unnamed protein product [Brassica napus]